MARLVQLIGSLSLRKGKIFTFIGVAICVISMFIMYDTRSVTSETLELILLGLIVSGLNKETIDLITNTKTNREDSK